MWLKLIGHLNLLCAHTTRAITNHTPISEYRLKFFPREEFRCPCSYYLIESRRHILHECVRFNGYWNPRRDSFSYFIMFLVLNPNAFSFCSLLGLFCSFLFLFFFFLSFFFSFFLSLSLTYVVMKVATIVCLCTPCNKLLI